MQPKSHLTKRRLRLEKLLIILLLTMTACLAVIIVELYTGQWTWYPLGSLMLVMSVVLMAALRIPSWRAENNANQALATVPTQTVDDVS